MSVDDADADDNLIRRIDLGGGVAIHVLNVVGQPYVVSKEVSNLFPKWKRRDLISKMIELRRLNYQKLVIDQLSGRDLFEQALWYSSAFEKLSRFVRYFNFFVVVKTFPALRMRKTDYSSASHCTVCKTYLI
jgi:hypothetical protein